MKEPEDTTSALMRAAGIPRTRENWIRVNNLGRLVPEYGEEEMPEDLRNEKLDHRRIAQGFARFMLARRNEDEDLLKTDHRRRIARAFARFMLACRRKWEYLKRRLV